MVYVVPDLGLTVVMTSDPTARSRDGYLEQLHGLLADGIVPAAAAAPGRLTAQSKRADAVRRPSIQSIPKKDQPWALVTWALAS